MIGILAHQATPRRNARVVLLFAALGIGWIGLDRIRGTRFHRLPRWGGSTLLGVGAVLLVAALVVPQLMARRIAATTDSSGSTATLAIVEPSKGEVIAGDTLTVGIDLQGGTSVAGASTDVRPDTGQIYVSLDGRLLSMTFSANEVFGASGLTTGSHVLEAEFVAADHLPFQPRVVERVMFEKGEAP
jgi:hypothetical protein